MLRKIDCVMIRVEKTEAAASYYADVFGLQPLWSGDGSIGLVFRETDAEIVFHCDPKYLRRLKSITKSTMSSLPWRITQREDVKSLSLPSTLRSANVRYSRTHSGHGFASSI